MSNNDQNQDKSITTPEVTDKPDLLTRDQFNEEWAQREAKLVSKFEKLLDQRAAAAKPTPEVEEKLSRTAELEKQVANLSKNVQDRDARDRDQALRSATLEGLRTIGINRDFEDHALSFLVDAKKMIKQTSDGSLQMTVGGVVYDDINAGMQAWNKTKDAKLYKPGSGAAGTGDRSKDARYGTDNGEQPATTMPTIKRDENGKMSKESRLALEKYFGG